MKKVILVFASVLISGSVFSQTDSLKINKMPSDELPLVKSKTVSGSSILENHINSKDTTTSNQNVKQKIQDGVFMEGSKMMMVSKGVVTAFNRELKMSNGTVAYSNGTYVLINGTRFEFKNGDEMNMSGALTQLK